MKWLNRVGAVLLVGSPALIGQAGSVAGYAQSTQAQAGAQKQVSFIGVSFSYSSSLGAGVTTRVEPELKNNSWLSHPEQVVFEFQGFHSLAQDTVTPTIYVFPVKSSYKYLYPDESVDFWLNGVKGLQAALSHKPDLTASPHDPNSPGILPPINAAEIFVGQQKYIRFGSGFGVRYLVQITQQPDPTSADNTFYTYQGISDDGKYYISALFPAFMTTPPNVPFNFTDQQGLDNYHAQVRAALNSAGSSQFTPNLDLLDSLMRSLTIAPAGVAFAQTQGTPGMPGTGQPAANFDTDLAGSLFVCAAILLACGMLLRLKKPCSY